MKALYLDGRSVREVRLDGPALRVASCGRADGRYPLPRLARIVTVGEVHWHPRALLACFHAGVPIAMLDRRGRFVRLRFSLPRGASGLASHLGELLTIERYRRRYELWLHETERRDSAQGLREAGLLPEVPSMARLWQWVLVRQSAAFRCRMGGVYAYLRGLTLAQLACAFGRLGLPNDPDCWSPQEYRLVNDFASLEQWRHVAIVARCSRRGALLYDRRALTMEFEAEAVRREQRFTQWRQSLLLRLMGLNLDAPAAQVADSPARGDNPLTVPQIVVNACETALGAIGSNMAWLPRAPKDSLRTSARILRAWLEYDRRNHEHY